jgi:hypothetical protein
MGIHSFFHGRARSRRQGRPSTALQCRLPGRTQAFRRRVRISPRYHTGWPIGTTPRPKEAEPPVDIAPDFRVVGYDVSPSDKRWTIVSGSPGTSWKVSKKKTWLSAKAEKQACCRDIATNIDYRGSPNICNVYVLRRFKKFGILLKNTSSKKIKNLFYKYLLGFFYENIFRNILIRRWYKDTFAVSGRPLSPRPTIRWRPAGAVRRHWLFAAYLYIWPNALHSFGATWTDRYAN